MPELPEVEIIKKFLEREILNSKILNVEIFSKKQFIGNPQKIINKKIKAIERRGKFLIFKLKNKKSQENIYLLFHLKLSGQILFSKDYLSEKSTRVIIKLNNGYLIFNEPRKLGWIKVVDEDGFKKEILNLGKEPLDKDFKIDYFKKIIKNSSRSIKVLLMDQKKIAGVGNIYASEALFLAKIDPRRKANSLTDQEIKNLYNAIKKVLKKGIKYGGASVRFYIRPDKSRGKFQEKTFVYAREGKKCYQCGEIIQKIKLGGRGTYFCPKCQK